MNPNPRIGASPDAAWLDIPDPVRLSPVRAGAPPNAPGVPSLDRGQVRKRRWATLAGCIAWPVIVVLSWGPRGDARDVLVFVVLQSALWMTLVVTGARAALSPGKRGLGRPIATIALAVIGIPAVFEVLGLLWLPQDAHGAFAEIGTIAQWRSCVALGLLVVLPMVGASFWALRRSFPSAASWRGAALGASCGLAAASVLTLHCGITLGGHIALAHGAPVLLATLSGMFAGSKLGRA